MARVPSKHERDQAMDFQGFLNDLQDWEVFKDTDKKMKKSLASGLKTGNDRKSTGKTPAIDHSRNLDAINHLSRGYTTEESTMDATSEKELGNEYFKQKKFNEAIECYSRSIVFSPTAVAYANRAMAYLKIKRFQEAEDDCTEALNLDDRYVKAYSRRATARKELGKLKQSIEDSEFALKLEPNNQEIKKQYADVKSFYEKEILQKASGVLRSSLQGSQKGGRLEKNVNGHVVDPVSNATQSTVKSASRKGKTKENDGQGLMKKSIYVEEIENKTSGGGSGSNGQVGNEDCANASPSSHVESFQRNHKAGRQELRASVNELASRAASHAMAEAAKNITPPNSAYQFEVSWRGFSGDRALQAQLLKVTPPSSLPQIFKNALSAPTLMDIIKCVATFFIDDMGLAVKYLENLTKVPRFDMLIMFLSSMEKADLVNLWNEVFCNEAPMEYAEILDNLRSKYCPCPKF